jgi:hypothetical protein
MTAVAADECRVPPMARSLALDAIEHLRLAVLAAPPASRVHVQAASDLLGQAAILIAELD